MFFKGRTRDVVLYFVVKTCRLHYPQCNSTVHCLFLEPPASSRDEELHEVWWPHPSRTAHLWILFMFLYSSAPVDGDSSEYSKVPAGMNTCRRLALHGIHHPCTGAWVVYASSNLMFERLLVTTQSFLYYYGDTIWPISAMY